MGDNCQIEGQGGITFGNNVLLASKVFVCSTSHGVYQNDNEIDSPFTPPSKRKIVLKPVVIGDNCWIGNGVSILQGVTIGSGCVIGANSVVTKDIPENSIVAGVPAKVIKKFDGKEWKRI